MRLYTPSSSELERIVCRIARKRIVHFIHVGKAGGTAVKAALSRHRTTDKYRIWLHGHSFVFSMVPSGDAAFFILRHPVSRFVSAFYSRQRQGKPRFYSPWTAGEQNAFRVFETPNDLALALSSSDDDLRMAARQAMRSIQHIRNTYRDHFFGDVAEFMARRKDVLFVGFQERLDADFEGLKSVLGLPADLRLPKNETARHRNPPGLSYDLQGEAKANLEAWYAEDIRFYLACMREFGSHHSDARFS